MRYSKLELEITSIYDLYRSLILFTSDQKSEIINRIKIHNPEFADRIAGDLKEIDSKILDLLDKLNAIEDNEIEGFNNLIFGEIEI